MDEQTVTKASANGTKVKLLLSSFNISVFETQFAHVLNIFALFHTDTCALIFQKNRPALRQL